MPWQAPWEGSHWAAAAELLQPPLQLAAALPLPLPLPLAAVVAALPLPLPLLLPLLRLLLPAQPLRQRKTLGALSASFATVTTPTQ